MIFKKSFYFLFFSNRGVYPNKVSNEPICFLWLYFLLCFKRDFWFFVFLTFKRWLAAGETPGWLTPANEGGGQMVTVWAWMFFWNTDAKNILKNIYEIGTFWKSIIQCILLFGKMFFWYMEYLVLALSLCFKRGYIQPLFELYKFSSNSVE